jgi:hypothetical protein
MAIPSIPRGNQLTRAKLPGQDRQAPEPPATIGGQASPGKSITNGRGALLLRLEAPSSFVGPSLAWEARIARPHTPIAGPFLFRKLACESCLIDGTIPRGSVSSLNLAPLTPKAGLYFVSRPQVGKSPGSSPLARAPQSVARSAAADWDQSDRDHPALPRRRRRAVIVIYVTFSMLHVRLEFFVGPPCPSPEPLWAGPCDEPR